MRTMLTADSDLPPSISPPLIPSSIETLDESIAVQSLALSSPCRVPDVCGDQAAEEEEEEEVSIPSRFVETLTAPSQQAPPPDEFDEPFADICLSDNYKRWTPNVYDSDDESSTSYWLKSYNQQPLIVQDEQPSGVGVGLWNLGNSCFVNSVLQCLTHTVPLINSLCAYKSPAPCNCGNEWFCVRSALKGHIEDALTTSTSSIAPYYFLNNLNYFSADFRRYQQEDAHEFLQAFLDKLERCCFDPCIDPDPDSVSPQDVNLVQRIFGGRLVSELRCCNCNSVSETFENSLGLSLEIEDVDNLQSALDSFTRVEKLDEPMTCDDCKEKVSKEKQLSLYKLPQVVTFHLKRFKNNGYFMEKIFNHVEFPLEIDLQPYMIRSQNNEVSTKYRLYAFVEHFGSLAYGHYSSYVRSAPKIWHKFDDKQVTRIDEDRVLSQDAYILFYAREGIPLFSSTLQQEVHPLVEASLQNPSPNSVLDPTSGECSSEISYENTCKSSKLCEDSAGVTDLLQQHVKPADSSRVAVAKLIDGYLSEIARIEPNLSPLKFIAIAEKVSCFPRSSHDGVYRAIDMFLKEHPGITKSEKKSICRLMDCRKLSPEACAHAVQNERLPLRVVVQILFFEQVRATSKPSLPPSGSHGSSRTTTEEECDSVTATEDTTREKTSGSEKTKAKGVAMSRIFSKLWTGKDRDGVGDVSSSSTSESPGSATTVDDKSTPSTRRRRSSS